MKLSKIRFLDFTILLWISGISLLTMANYVETIGGGCSVNNRTPFPPDASGDEVERWLRGVLRDHRILPATNRGPLKEESNDGTR